jgi:hypothetical protein
MGRSVRWAMAAIASAALASSLLAAESPASQGSYWVRVESAHHAQVTFSGSYVLNGHEVRVHAATTPWEYRCEAGETITGTFRADDAEKPIRVAIHEGGPSAAKPAAEAKGAALEFAWAPTGAGPRFVGLEGRAKAAKPAGSK